MTTGPGDSQRLDKWLWHARFFKTRSLAAALCRDGRVRLNGQRVDKSSTPVKPGDVLTFVQADYVRVVRVAGLAARRGPVAAAQQLYQELNAPGH